MNKFFKSYSKKIKKFGDFTCFFQFFQDKVQIKTFDIVLF